MSTTELFIEHLITGIQAFIWICLLLISLLPIDPHSLMEVGDHLAVAIPLSLAFIYPLGIFIDNLADILLNGPNESIKKMYRKGRDISVSKVLSKTNDPDLAQYFGYLRMRIRLSRSSFLNFLLIGFALLIFTFNKHSELGLNRTEMVRLVYSEILVSGLLAYFAYWSWKNISQNYHERTVRIGVILDLIPAIEKPDASTS